jgi:hypothetical protein
MNDMTLVFESVAYAIVKKHEDALFNYGFEEQIDLAVEQLQNFHKLTPLVPVSGKVIDLAGFGEAPIHFESAEHDKRYLLVTQVGAALGVEPWKACAWSRREWEWAVLEQRSADEERGDGRIGYEGMRDHLDLRVDFIAEGVPDAKPDANGQRWENYGEWLISDDRLLAFLMDSPWGHEFFENAKDHMGIAFMKSFGQNARDEQERDMMDRLFGTDVPEDEALRKARRGPSIDL